VFLAPLLMLASCGESGESEVRSASPFESEVDEAPTDATRDAFCLAWAPSVTKLNSPEEYDEWAKEMIAVGTPAEFSDEQRKGFVVYVSSVREFPAVIISPTSSARPKVTEEEQRWVDALSQWVILNCEAEILAENDLPQPTGKGTVTLEPQD
jgi:hypothetical protein